MLFHSLRFSLLVYVLLTCSSFLREIGSCCFPPWFVQDVERVVDFRVCWGEGAQAADAADDGHVLVDQRCHPLAVQVTAVAVVTCNRKESFSRTMLIIWCNSVCAHTRGQQRIKGKYTYIHLYLKDIFYVCVFLIRLFDLTRFPKIPHIK